jgi:hypothetical protein
MKKIFTIALCLGFAFTLFAAEEDMVPLDFEDNHVYRTGKPSNYFYDGPRTTATLVDTINLGSLYWWGLTYDWDRDLLWINRWPNSALGVYAIRKTSPFTKVDSFQLADNNISLHLGTGYAGDETLYMADSWDLIYKVDMETGASSIYRTVPWSYCQGLGYNAWNDAIYPASWNNDEVAWAMPSQSGPWHTWSFPTNPSGCSGSWGPLSADWLFVVDESSQCHLYQYALTGGVPDSTPIAVWELDPGQTQESTADCAYDGRYVYVLDQSEPTDLIWIYDVGLFDTLRWDFEDGHQGWEHTNGQAFPAGWDVVKSGLHASYTPPGAGDSTYWIDADSADPGIWVQDTVISPLIMPDTAHTGWLWWGIGYNRFSSGEWIEVGIRYYDGSSWSIVPLDVYIDDTGPKWDSVDVSAYNTYDYLQVYFYYDDNNGAGGYVAFDNVSIFGRLIVPSNNVGTSAINIPDVNVKPDTTVNPAATYRNFSLFNKTFDVYFVIDSIGHNVYMDVRHITLDPGNDTTISFDPWTCGNGIWVTYDIRAYTVLPGDVYPGNDTLRKQTMINPTYWEILADIPEASSGHSEATLDDGHYMVFGFHPSSGYSSAIYDYDITNDSWTTKTPNPYGCGAYGMAYGVNGRYYRIGGTDNWPTPLDRVDIYDPVTDTWSAGAPAPMANMDMIGGVYRDSLIFMFGGGNWGDLSPHTHVFFYDTYEDTWSTCTDLPVVGRGCLAGGVIGDYAIVACGYDYESNYRNDYILGIINPADPTMIIWGSSTEIPGNFKERYRVASGVNYPAANNPQELWVTCGQAYSYPQGIILADIWSYEPNSDTWTDWHMPKHLAIGNVNSLAITETALNDMGVYVAGGYTLAIRSIVTNHEVFHTTRYTGIEEMPAQKEPSVIFGFDAVIKNPTDDYSAITYTTTKPGKVMVKIYDVTGRLVKTLVNRRREPAGTKTVYWNGKDKNGRMVPPGIYFCRLTAENRNVSEKIVVIN